jgi:hypothetical protein
MNWARVAYLRMVKNRKGKAFKQCLLAAFQNLSEPFPFQFPKVARTCPAPPDNNIASYVVDNGGLRLVADVGPPIT